MLTIVCYDAASRRGARLMKICRKYLKHMQKSVFVGILTEGKLNQLKRELNSVIVYEEDLISIICISVLKYVQIEQLGKTELNDNQII